MKNLEEGKKVRVVNWPSHEWIDQNGLHDGCTLNDLNLQYIIFTQWEFYIEPVKTYTFMEAVQLMKEGKKMRRPDWIDKAYVHFNIHGYADKYIDPRNWNLEDFESIDWIIVE